MSQKTINQETGEESIERTLVLEGTIAEDPWFDDEVSPKMFKDELDAGDGDITVWINSPGGDCIAAAQIYNMLQAYKGKVTVKIDGIAASAASVIAMAGDTVYMSPVSMMMIHNPATIAFGDHVEMQKAMDMLSEVKESILNAYTLKTGQSRAKLSHLMDAETWMNANKAVELGFADDIWISHPEDTSEEYAKEEEQKTVSSFLFSRKAVNNALLNKVAAKYGKETQPVAQQAEIPVPETVSGRKVSDVLERLDVIKKFI